MSDEIIDNQDVSTGDQTEENQTVTAEQFGALQKQLEESQKMFEDLKKAQSGSDKTVTELQKLLKQKEQERANEKLTIEERNAKELAELRAAIEQERSEKLYIANESLAKQMLIDADIKVPRTISRLIGKTEEETLKYVEDYIADWQDREAEKKDIYAKKGGRKVVDTTLKSMDAMSYEDMANLPQEKFDAIPKDVVNKAMNAALRK
jgi:hypothetical protein